MSQLSRAVGIPGAHSREGGGGTPTQTWGGHVTAEPGHRYPGRPLPGGGGGGTPTQTWGGHVTAEPGRRHPGRPLPGGGGYSDTDMGRPCHS